MFKSCIYCFLTFLTCNLHGFVAARQVNPIRSVCLLNDPPNQCGEFCLEALKPMLDHIALHQKEWSTCDPQKLNDSQERLDRIESNLQKLLDQREASSKNMDRIEAQLAALQESLSKAGKGRISNLFTRIGTRLIFIEKEIRQTWKGAEAICRQMGGHLATIQDQSDLNAIVGKLDRGCSYWLGLSDEAKEGEFISMASGRPAPFLKWKVGQPNNFQGRDHCVDIYNGEMYDTDCNDPEYFICEAVG
ncbi:accessory gland protein Acp29AB-like [Drosophila gunungcola]|uniref:C-type lectin domain-containing protein n=1 Tax=Drosophila gunungcola TaxID=103775 RepID=A0A9Q0BS38_9MUSC|nr:accessory gland protein Acp29AB-like [Drosophila gunungcola]KAI8041855.1 hypothetical protein M5D96_006125 [Drosophila gunungcola]